MVPLGVSVEEELPDLIPPQRRPDGVFVGERFPSLLIATPRLLLRVRHFFTLRLPGAARRFARNDYAGVDLLYRRWSPTWRYTAEDLEGHRWMFTESDEAP